MNNSYLHNQPPPQQQQQQQQHHHHQTAMQNTHAFWSAVDELDAQQQSPQPPSIPPSPPVVPMHTQVAQTHSHLPQMAHLSAEAVGMTHIVSSPSQQMPSHLMPQGPGSIGSGGTRSPSGLAPGPTPQQATPPPLGYSAPTAGWSTPVPQLATVRAPKRSMHGWALVRKGNALRSSRRYVVVKAGTVAVYEGPETRSPSLLLPLTGAVLSANPAKLECTVRTQDALRVSFSWPTDADMYSFKGAFDFANRVLDDRFKAVSHRLLARRNDSEVVFGFDKATGEHAAIKVINKDRSGGKTVAESEVAIRMSIDHRAIVKTVDVFETPFDLFIVMNYMDGGSLARRVGSKHLPPITEIEARCVMVRIFSALSYLHANGIVHRNVKPENILLEHPTEPRWPMTCRLSDFRMACFLDPSAAPSPDAADFVNQVVGTPDYLAPEAAVMTNQADGTRKPCVGPETDMWATGVTLFNILSCGSLPFHGATTPEVLRNARHVSVANSFGNIPAFQNVSDSAKSLICALLNPDRRKRPTADSVLCHPWFQGTHSMNSLGGRGPIGVGGDARALSNLTPLVGFQRFRAVVAVVRFMYRLAGAVAPATGPRLLYGTYLLRQQQMLRERQLQEQMRQQQQQFQLQQQQYMALQQQQQQQRQLQQQSPFATENRATDGEDSASMKFVAQIAGVNISPSAITMGKGVNIEPETIPPGVRRPPHALHMSGGMETVAHIPLGAGTPEAGMATPYHFTTSTLSPPSEGLLRTSQTSSVGSVSVRSSQSSSQTEIARMRMPANQSRNGFIGGIMGVIRRDQPSMPGMSTPPRPPARAHLAQATPPIAPLGGTAGGQPAQAAVEAGDTVSSRSYVQVMNGTAADNNIVDMSVANVGVNTPHGGAISGHFVHVTSQDQSMESSNSSQGASSRANSGIPGANADTHVMQHVSVQNDMPEFGVGDGEATMALGIAPDPLGGGDVLPDLHGSTHVDGNVMLTYATDFGAGGAGAPTEKRSTSLMAGDSPSSRSVATPSMTSRASSLMQHANSGLGELPSSGVLTAPRADSSTGVAQQLAPPPASEKKTKKKRFGKFSDAARSQLPGLGL